MNTIKTLLAMAALAGSAYAVYVSIFEHPSDLPPEQVAAELGFQPPDFSGPTVGPAPMPMMPGTDAPPGWGQGGHASPSGTSPFAPPGSSDPYTSSAAMPDAAAVAAVNPRGPWADPFSGAAPLGNPPGQPAYDASAGTPGDSPYAMSGAPDPTGGLTPLERPNGVKPAPVPGQEAATEDDEGESLDVIVQRHLEKNELLDALKLLSPYYDWEPGTALPPEDAEVLNELLDQLAGSVVYSREHWLAAEYQPQPGETLEQIAQTHNVPAQLLAKVNGVAVGAPLAPGASLKLIPGPFEAIVDAQQQRLTLRVGGLYAGRFQLSPGESAPSSSGEYVVRDKINGPAYNGPNGSVPAGAPGNPLGARWIDLGNGIGIHALADDAQLTTPGGPGCLRVSNRDADDLFDILSIGSRVIVYSGSPAPPAPATPGISSPGAIAATPGFESGSPGYSAPAGYSAPGGYAAPSSMSAPPGYAAPPGYGAPPLVSELPAGSGGELR